MEGKEMEFVHKVYATEEKEERRKRISCQIIPCSWPSSSLKKKKKVEDNSYVPSSSSDQSSSSTDSSSSSSSRKVLIEEFPRDMIYEIFSHFPWSSKELGFLHNDSNFKQFHSQSRRNQTLYGYVIETMSHFVTGHNYATTSFDFFSFKQKEKEEEEESLVLEPKSIIPRLIFFETQVHYYYKYYHLRIVSSYSSLGLFCCLVYQENIDALMTKPTDYCICQPGTKEFRLIPLPKSNLNCLDTKVVIVHNGDDPVLLHYKIFRFSSQSPFDVFDAESWEWTTLDTTVDYSSLPRPRGCPYLDDTGVLVHGSINWLTEDENICSLNVNSYSWKVIDIPKDEDLSEMNDIQSRSLKNKLVDCEGDLGLMILSSSRRWLELWVLKKKRNIITAADKNTSSSIWMKNYRVSLEPVLRNKTICFIEVLDYYTTDIVLVKINDEILWFDINNASYLVAVEKVPPRFGRVHKLHSDFVPRRRVVRPPFPIECFRRINIPSTHYIYCNHSE